jgi:hypothetical protein
MANEKQSKEKQSNIGSLISKDRLAKIWMGVAIGAVVGFTVDRHFLVERLSSKPLFFAMDANTFYISKLGTFEEAKLFHTECAKMAAGCLFDRNPSGQDYQERSKLLFSDKLQNDVRKFVDADAERFRVQKIHQKFEFGKIDFLKNSDNDVLAAVQGQLVQHGVLDESPWDKTVPVTLYLDLVVNHDMASNSRYPEWVAAFNVKFE